MNGRIFLYIINKQDFIVNKNKKCGFKSRNSKFQKVEKRKDKKKRNEIHTYTGQRRGTSPHAFPLTHPFPHLTPSQKSSSLSAAKSDPSYLYAVILTPLKSLSPSLPLYLSLAFIEDEDEDLPFSPLKP